MVDYVLPLCLRRNFLCVLIPLKTTNIVVEGVNFIDLAINLVCIPERPLFLQVMVNIRSGMGEAKRLMF